MRKLQYPKIEPTFLILAIFLTAMTNLRWAYLPSYDLTFAIGFSVAFFVPLYYKLVCFIIRKASFE